jgi:sterol desaturase/sphingolipid hydroxylase (fatty acid hydroxylase superfamily)
MNLLQSDNQWSQSIDPKRTMTKAAFFSSYASHYAVLIYVAIVLATGGLSLYLMQSWWQLLGSFALVALVYPAVEFVLHRFVLHSRTLYRMPWTAGLWRRIHYDHHMNPNDLSVLFGAPYTTIPAVLAPTLPLGYLAFGWPGAAATVCGGFIALLIYEFFHCAAHLPVKFDSRIMQHMRRHHALHHFHSENGNYGIVTDVLDRVLGTEYEAGAGMGPSPTVRNLGYTSEEAKKYPWVAQLDQAQSRH